MMNDLDDLDDIGLSARTITVMVAIVFACLIALAVMRNPEPALPHCKPDMPVQIRCQP